MTIYKVFGSGADNRVLAFLHSVSNMASFLILHLTLQEMRPGNVAPITSSMNAWNLYPDKTSSEELFEARSIHSRHVELVSNDVLAPSAPCLHHSGRPILGKFPNDSADWYECVFWGQCDNYSSLLAVLTLQTTAAHYQNGGFLYAARLQNNLAEFMERLAV